ncbi:MAG: phage holin family protein [Candidatus Altimarinota bacterium]
METIVSTNWWVYLCAAGFFNYLGLPREQLKILAVLMLFDFITGVMKQYALDRSKIESGRAWLGLMKKFTTIIFIFTVAFVFRSVDVFEQFYIKTVLSAIIIAEAYSIIQNIYCFRTGQAVKEVDAITFVLQKIGSTFEGVLKKMVDAERDDFPPKK